MFLNITVLILIILILIVYNQNKENFNVLQTTNDCNTNPYDPKCLLLNVTKQSDKTVSDVAKVLDTPVLEPFDNTNINTADLTTLVDKCEKTTIPPNQCNVFDDTFFATNCGISFDPNGKDHNDNPHQGGLYINDKKYNYFFFDKIKNLLFENLFIRKNQKEKIALKNIPLLAYIIYYISGILVSKKIWLYNNTEQNNTIEINIQKSIIHTLIDLIYLSGQ